MLVSLVDASKHRKHLIKINAGKSSDLLAYFFGANDVDYFLLEYQSTLKILTTENGAMQ